METALFFIGAGILMFSVSVWEHYTEPPVLDLRGRLGTHPVLWTADQIDAEIIKTSPYGKHCRLVGHFKKLEVTQSLRHSLTVIS